MPISRCSDDPLRGPRSRPPRSGVTRRKQE